MKKQIMYLLSRTPVHVGAGNSVGVVDSPIMRERHTKTPIIPGSSLKGLCSDLWNDDEHKRTADGNKLFGEVEDKKVEGSKNKSGQLLIGEGRVLAFPVRSAKGSFAWITSPHALQKFSRDTGVEIDTAKFDKLTDTKCFACSGVVFENAVILEEYKLTKEGDCSEIADTLSNLFKDQVWNSVANKLVVVNDEMFSYFVEQKCKVVNRICIDDKTVVVKNGALFNQEQVPSETLFYSIVGTMKGEELLTQFTDKIKSQEVIQVGGNATIGLGYCSVNFG